MGYCRPEETIYETTSTDTKEDYKTDMQPPILYTHKATHERPEDTRHEQPVQTKSMYRDAPFHTPHKATEPTDTRPQVHIHSPNTRLPDQIRTTAPRIHTKSESKRKRKNDNGIFNDGVLTYMEQDTPEITRHTSHLDLQERATEAPAAGTKQLLSPNYSCNESHLNESHLNS